MTIDRRELLQGFAGLGLAAMLPARAFARPAEDWPHVRAVMPAFAPGKLAGVGASIGRGLAPPEYMFAGTIDHDSKTPVDADSLWRLYSMTKPITGMAAMMLVEDGKLKLDQNIADFIPGFANPRVLIDGKKSLDSRPATAPIRVRNLITHTAGLGYNIISTGPLLDALDRLGLDPARGRQPVANQASRAPTPPLDVFVDRLATLPLIADPGTIWSYSMGLDVMARVIEIVSGKHYDAFLQERMFGPLGMKSSWFQVPASEAHRLTTTYFMTPAGLVPGDPGPTSVFLKKPAIPSGGVGVVSSARDYDRFLLMLAGLGSVGGKRIMKPETVQLAMSNLLPPGVSTAGTFAGGQGFGAGGQVILKPSSNGQSVGSFGWSGAAGTTAWVDPVRKLRCAGYAQLMPPNAVPFQQAFTDAVKADV